MDMDMNMDISYVGSISQSSLFIIRNYLINKIRKSTVT